MPSQDGARPWTSASRCMRRRADDSRYTAPMYIDAEQPERALAGAGLEPARLSGGRGLAIVEVAGRDSVAAAVVAVREHGFSTLLPTTVATGTEYGDEHASDQAVEHLASLVGDGVVVLSPLRLGSPRLWSAICGRYASAIAERYRIQSPCLGCHLYMHLARVPLARALGGAPIVAGERELHGERVKLSQNAPGIDASIRAVARAGIELIEPIRRVRDGEEIAGLVGDGWSADERQLRCVHSGNYIGLDGEVVYDELAYARYVRGFLEPVGAAIVDAWAVTPEPEYEEIVRCVLEGPDAA